MATSYRRIESVMKSGEILKYLASQKGPVTGPEVARVVGLPTGTVMCHLVSLADLGFVLQVGEGWQLGMGLALIWARVKSNLESGIDRQTQDLKSITTGDK